MIMGYLDPWGWRALGSSFAASDGARQSPSVLEQRSTSRLVARSVAAAGAAGRRAWPSHLRIDAFLSCF